MQAGKKFDRFLTILMIASLIIMVLTIVYVVMNNKGGPTNWAIWLHDINIETLVNAEQEIIVMNYSQEEPTGMTEGNMFSSVEIARIKASGKQVYAYLSLPDNYWTNTTVLNELTIQIAKAGFDGVYLTNINSYQRKEFEILSTLNCLENSTCPDPSTLVSTDQTLSYRALMINLIVDIAKTARQQKESFKLFLGDGYELLEQNNTLWATIDGVGKESLIFENGEERSEDAINYDLAILDQAVAADKLVLVMEYDLTEKTQNSKLCTQTQIHKYVPGAAPSTLDSIDQEKVCK